MNRPIIFRRCAIGALLSFMLGVSFLAQAQQGTRFTALEISSLPQYCQDKKFHRNNEKWSNTLGYDTWFHLHHFCNGLIFYSRASTELDGRRRLSSCSEGINEFSYVLKHWPPNSPFYQQALMYREQLEFYKKFVK